VAVVEAELQPETRVVVAAETGLATSKPLADPEAEVHSEAQAIAVLHRVQAALVARPAWVRGAAECAAVVVVAGNKHFRQGRDVTMNNENFGKTIVIPAACVLFLAFAFGTSCGVRAQQPTKPAETQRAFDTPEAGVAALIEAAGNFDVAALSAILGPGSEDIIVTADPVSDKNRTQEFAALGKEKQSIELATDKKQATVSVGEEQWPFPIPIVNRGGKWYFDSKRGRSEILKRRIGSNELDAIAVCRGFVQAQEEYASVIHDNSGLNQYAQRIISTPGKQDGLYWVNADGTGGGPISEPIAKAIQEGYPTDVQNAFHGYYYKVLKGRGPSAPGGEINFVIGGAMIGGFALAAAPAQYGVTGIKSFIISYEGIVYQKDLGQNGLETLSKIESYNPDKTWTVTNDEWPFDIAVQSH
jgi:hypothetical protein